MNKITSFYHIEQGSQYFFIGAKVKVYLPRAGIHYGKITHITSKGFYLDVGNKKDKYFNFNREMEISTWDGE